MDTKKFNLFGFILIFSESMLIGVGGVLPGISGGLICVLFGFYRPLMETLADPIHRLVPNLNLLIPLALGAIAGTLVSAGAVSEFLGKYNTIATFAFVGLIIGTLPDMWHDAGKQGRTKWSVSALIITTVLFTALLITLELATKVELPLNIFWFFFAGVFVGFSIVIPGFAFSSTLMFFGLYEPLMAGVKQLKAAVILPALLGLALVIVTLPRFVSNFFEKHHSIVSHITMGIVIGTSIPLFIKLNYTNTSHNVVAASMLVACALFAYALSVFMPKLAEKFSKK